MDDWGITSNVIATFVAALLIYLARPIWRRIREELRPPSDHDVTSESQGSATPQLRKVVPTPEFPAGTSLIEKVVHLERQYADVQNAAVAARRQGVDDRAFEERCAVLDEALREMSFISAGDVLDDRYRLLARVGSGRVSVVWKAYDLARDKVVAVKLLCYPHIHDESVVRRCHYTVRVMSELSAANVAAVNEQVRELEVAGERKLVYYILEYVDGEPLDSYATRYPNQKARLIDGILELGRSLADAHAKGIVHRDLKPSNILVHADGTMKLVDFDSVLRLGDRRVSHRDIGTFGYSAPEVLNATSDPDMRADIFALGRVVSYLYYGGSDLPNVYEQSVYDVIDLLNCAPVVKESLEQATAVPPSRRYPTMKDFLTDLGRAVTEDREYPLPFLPTMRREWNKISALLQQSFYGTFVTMIVARPTFAGFGLAHLSDVARVGAFHAIIGSLVWGTFISGAFILFLILFGRSAVPRVAKYMTAALCCGMGGLLGGMLVAVPSVFVTNGQTLTCLGWLTNADSMNRLQQALLETRMMLAYPLTGLLTGVGTGIALYRGIEIALRLSPQGSGVLPVPAKRSPRAPLVGASVLRSLLLSPSVHLALAFPIVFSFAVSSVLNAAAPPPTSIDICRGVVPNELWRSVGEGIVHYCGALGLVAGFFWRVPPSTPTSSLSPDSRGRAFAATIEGTVTG
jgi:tRNA A-37 threonylcarbamoyl transferase component Bud32